MQKKIISKIRLGNRFIGKGFKPFVIAEAGINHNGDLKKAFAMIKAAKLSGAAAIKFQTFKAEEFIATPRQMFTYQSQGKKIRESMLYMFKRYEFSRSEWFRINEKCDKEGIMFLSTPQNNSDLNLLIEIGVKAIKVGSDDFTNIPLLKEYVKTKLPLILSCGMTNLLEIRKSLKEVGAYEGYPVVLLYCVSQYPTPAQDTNMLKLRTLRRVFPRLILGFSDHTEGYAASTLAVGFGALVFEKHFTLDKKLPGPDHWFSEDTYGLKAWVSAIRQAHTMLGSEIVKPTKKEKLMKIIARRSIVAVRDIRKGEVFNSCNLALKRPGTGLPAYLLERILYKEATRDIKENTLIKRGDFI